MKRPQNTERPWKIEYKNEDGHMSTFRSSYCTALAAVQSAHFNWVRNWAEGSENGTLECQSQVQLPITYAQENKAFIVYTDGFHTYTIFHRESVIYG
jgi:hypothetical protein